MKIKQIRLISPELYLVTYVTRWLKREVERYVIYSREKNESSNIFAARMHDRFYFRDNDELAHDCWHQIEWMIRNEIEFFDNTKNPDPMWPRGDRHPICENCGKRHDLSEWCNPFASEPIKDPYPHIDLVEPVPYKRNIPNFREYDALPAHTDEVLTLDEWEAREPRVFITPATTDQYHIDETQKQVREITFDFAHQNGRLERDLEIKPFFEMFDFFRRNERGIILKDLCDLLSDLKPLNQEPTS